MITVTEQTKQIANGVEARVVHDVVREDGKPVEITDDWYAQDSRHAEDRSRVLALGQQAEVPFGYFTDVLLTQDYTPIEPDVLELKFYAKASARCWRRRYPAARSAKS